MRVLLDDEVTPPTWEDGPLARFLQSGCEEYCQRRPVVDAAYSLSVATDGWGDLDPEVLAVTRLVGADGRAVEPVDALKLDRVWPDWASETGDEIQGWMLYDGRANKSVRLWPKPTATATLTLEVQRLPFTRVDLTDEDADLEFPVHQGEVDAVLHWAAYLAYLVRNVEGHDPQAGERHRAAFELAVGPRPDARGLAFRAWAGGRRARVAVHT